MNTAINTNEAKNSIINAIEVAIKGTSNYISSTIDTKQVTISINGYGISIGKQSNGSYGISILMGDKRKELTFKSITDALKAFKDFILTAWKEGKSK